MAQRSRGDKGVPREADHDRSDPVLALLNARQWSYLKRRYDLTPREVEIADLACRGVENGRIAEHLRIRPGTVKAHVRNIYRKVRVSSKIRMLLRFVEESRELSGPGRVASIDGLD